MDWWSDDLPALFALGLGVLCFYAGYRQFAQGEASREWPHVMGTITAAKLRKAPNDPDSSTEYYGEITYEYALGDVVFTGTTISAGRERLELTAEESFALADHYPLHQPVAVYYDPTDPRRAVLEPGRSGRGALLMAVGGGMGALGAALLF